MCVRDLRPNPSVCGQWAVHPAQTRLGDFHPAFADRWQAALLERQAMTVGIEQRKVAVAAV